MPLGLAEVLTQLPRAVLSHQSAARVLGIDLLGNEEELAITVPRNDSRTRLDGWTVHRGDTTELRPGALRVTTPLRTLLDLSRVLPLPEAVAACDSALRKGLVSSTALRRRLGSAHGRGAAGTRAVAALVDDRCESVLESALRVVLLRSSLPRPRTQWAVPGSSPVARADFCWPEQRLVVEADGFAFHSERDAYRHDRARGNELVRLRWRVLRFTYEDVIGRPGHVVDLVRECLGSAA
jgi:very-short-patch-repair endonuclease